MERMKFGDIASEELSLDRLSKLMLIIAKIQQKIIISKKDLLQKLNIPKQDLKSIINLLIEKKYLNVISIEYKQFLFLTEKGRSLYKEKIRNVNLLKLFEDTIEELDIIPGSREIRDIPSFIGCFIADKNGKTLLTFEIYEGALEEYIKQHLSHKREDKPIDINLIPMFLSAFEKFSQEINVKNLTNLKIKGANLKIEALTILDHFTVTFFINPNVNLKPIKKKINQYFNHLFENYKEEFEISLKTGIISNISHLNQIGHEILKELNKFIYLVEFDNIVQSLDKFDMAYAQILYNKIEILEDEFNLNFSVFIEKIKKLKTHLIDVMLNKDLEDLKDIIHKAQKIESKLRKI